jgi:voltage-gated potassium channel
VTDSAVTDLDARREATLRYRAGGWAALRAVASAAVVVTIYYLLPWDRSSSGAAVTWLVIGLVLLIGLIAFQVRMIIRSPFPNLRAIEALATSLSLVLVLFAGTYVTMATHSASNFGEHLTHTDALYFTVTVFSTVGFGDITAKTEAARLVVTGQMITDLVVAGVGVRIILGAVTRGQQRRRQQRQDVRGVQSG